MYVGISVGVVVIINGASVHLNVRLSDQMGDSDGLRMAFDWKGTSPVRPCLTCVNVFKEDSDLAGRVGCMEITCCDPDGLAKQ